MIVEVEYGDGNKYRDGDNKADMFPAICWFEMIVVEHNTMGR